MMETLSVLFRALSEPLRIRIIHLLLHHGKEAYGEELARALNIPAYQLSRHLKVLKTTGLIRERREGRWVYYSLANRHGALLQTLRRLIAKADLPSTKGKGNGLSSSNVAPTAKSRGRRSRRAFIEQDGFNWNQGPAVPGIL